MEIHPQKHHWLNMYLGLIHEALGLTAEERLIVSGVLNRLLDSLRIPNRGVPKTLPIPLVMEFQNGFYSRKFADLLEGRTPESIPTRALEGDHIVPPEVWRAALMHLLETAYPDLAPEEFVAADKVFVDLFGALGVPQRRVRFLSRDIQVTQSAAAE